MTIGREKDQDNQDNQDKGKQPEGKGKESLNKLSEPMETNALPLSQNEGEEASLLSYFSTEERLPLLIKLIGNFLTKPENRGLLSRFFNDYPGIFNGAIPAIITRAEANQALIDIIEDKKIDDDDIIDELKQSDFQVWLNFCIALAINDLFDENGDLKPELYDLFNQQVTANHPTRGLITGKVLEEHCLDNEKTNKKNHLNLANDVKFLFVNGYMLGLISERKKEIEKYRYASSLEEYPKNSANPTRDAYLNFSMLASQCVFNITIDKKYIEKLHKKLDAVVADPNFKSKELQAQITEFRLRQAIQKENSVVLRTWGQEVLSVYKESDNPEERTAAYKLVKSTLENPLDCDKCFDVVIKARNSQEKKQELKESIKSFEQTAIHYKTKAEKLKTDEEILANGASTNKKQGVWLGLGTAALLVGAASLIVLFPPAIPLVALTATSLLIATGTITLGAAATVFMGISAYSIYKGLLGDKKAQEKSQKMSDTENSSEKLRAEAGKAQGVLTLIKEQKNRLKIFEQNLPSQRLSQRRSQRKSLKLSESDKNKSKGKEPEQEEIIITAKKMGK